MTTAFYARLTTLYDKQAGGAAPSCIKLSALRNATSPHQPSAAFNPESSESHSGKKGPHARVETSSHRNARARTMSSLKERVEEMTKQFGLTSKGSLKQDVDALREATDIPFTTMKETVDALACVCEFANEVVPKLCEDSGVEATGKLGDDVATLCKEIGVDQDDLKFPLALNALVESMGIDVKPNTLMKLVQLPMFAEAQKEPDVKKVDAPCVCKNGLHQLMSCKAKSHPCVCKDICLTATDQPMSYCKAKVHECVCTVRIRTTYSSDPHIENVCYERGLYRGYVRGFPSECRQHNDESDDDDVVDLSEEDVKPKKKKSRRK